MMSYFENLDNDLLNKYKKIINKKIINIYLLINWYGFKFYVISLSFNSPLKIIKLEPL
jgi:hypothetical protein